jgi:diguanylate cyclase (GGDEF)-like protein
MASIDIHTMTLALSIGNIGFALLMAGYIRSSTPDHGLRLWMWSRAFLGISQLLAWVRVEPWASGVQALGCVIGVVLELAAYCIYFRFRRWKRIVLPVALLSLMAIAFANQHGAAEIELLALTCAVIALFAGAMSYMLVRPVEGGASLLQRIIGINDAVFALAMAFSAWQGLVHPQQALGSSATYTFAGLASYLLMIVNGFGFLLLSKQKGDEQMALLATTDCLTGVANRRAFFEQADNARMLALRLRRPIALMMLDIDHFKQLNDRFGHATGDEALIVFTRTVRATLREHDLMGRLGGEEFALALPGTDLEGALQAAERLREAVAAVPLITSGSPYSMTVSVGVAPIDPNETLMEALARADHGLYAAKSAGRNRVEVGPAILKRA